MMTTTAPHPHNDGPRPVVRQRDRRRGLGDLLAGLSRSLAERPDTSLLRGAFDEALRRLVPVRSAH
jgi:hypothetical protein